MGLSEEILKLKDEQNDVEAAIDRVRAVSGQFQSADGVLWDQQLSKLSTENEDILVELSHLERSLTVTKLQYRIRQTKTYQPEIKIQQVEEELRNLNLNGEHLERDLENLSTELQAIKAAIENLVNLNNSLTDLGREGTAKTTREEEKKQLIGLIDEEDFQWTKRKLQIENQA